MSERERKAVRAERIRIGGFLLAYALAWAAPWVCGWLGWMS